MNKFGAKKTEVAGIVFDSRAEAKRYADLVMLQKAGHIAGLTRQVAYELAPSVKFEGEKRAKPAMRYVADFVYSDTATGKIVCEDVKGVQTPLFRAKRHWLLATLGIHIMITK
jgi:hypothetical protein